MTIFSGLVHTPLASALGWTLFHSLWEGVIAAAALAVALCIARSSRVRYLCAGVAMIAILTAAAITLFRMMPEPSHPFTTPQVIPAPVPALDLISGAMSNQLRVTEVVPWLTPFWIAGVIVFYLRGAASWAAARRLRRTGVCLAPEAWQQRLQQLGERLKLATAVSLLESSIANTPVVMGFLRPVILTPIGMLSGMPTSQIESILLHELAHVHRGDYLANLLQTVAEGLLFYHPAVWWISHVIRVERENCCDDLVVKANGNAHEYAIALSALAESRLTAAALSASGGTLMKRIRRLLYPEAASPSFVMPLFSAGLIVLITAAAATAWQSAQPAPKIAAPWTPAGTPEAAKPVVRQIAQAQSTRPVLPPAAAPEIAPNADPDALKNELGTPWKKWLNEDVTYIITDVERQAFLRLQADAEREQFVEQFWLRRDPSPGTPLNEYEQEHYRRIQYVDSNFGDRTGTPGWKTDRGRIYISFGPPDEIDAHHEGTADKAPFEDWRYRFLEGIGTNVMMEFVDSARTGEYRMTMDPNEKDAIRVPQTPADSAEQRLLRFQRDTGKPIIK
jgi:GWxTD domain-containing protein